jgi:guanosine-diphosphatase
LIQYALMIDAGSTGSRIHVYRFNNCGPTPELEHEEFKMTEKRPGGAGLSAYGDDPQGAAKSLDVLMEVAMKTVPAEYKPCSPIALKATAGLRLLGAEKSQKILDAVRAHLENNYPFPVVSEEKNGVVIMDGSEEGVYAWITTNYLLGKIGGPDKTPTAAVFDLGGGSTQIVFQPTFKQSGGSGGMPKKMEPGDHKYELTFGGREFELYQHSHLGYGLMEARTQIHKAVAASHRASHSGTDDWSIKPIENPCIIPNTKEAVTVELDGKKHELTMKGPERGSAAQCRGIAEKILNKDKTCNLAPCSFNGIHQPSLEKTFAVEDVYIFSYFYDRLNPLGMPESFTLREMRDLTAKVCSGESEWGTFEAVEGAVEELKDRPEHCLDLNFMMALLHTGYEMPIDREVRIAKKIKGNELGWCLGAR